MHKRHSCTHTHTPASVRPRKLQSTKKLFRRSAERLLKRTAHNATININQQWICHRLCGMQKILCVIRSATFCFCCQFHLTDGFFTIRSIRCGRKCTTYVGVCLSVCLAVCICACSPYLIITKYFQIPLYAKTKTSMPNWHQLFSKPENFIRFHHSHELQFHSVVHGIDTLAPCFCVCVCYFFYLASQPSLCCCRICTAPIFTML